jgi:hypothetical protein
VIVVFYSGVLRRSGRENVTILLLDAAGGAEHCHFDHTCALVELRRSLMIKSSRDTNRKREIQSTSHPKIEELR